MGFFVGFRKTGLVKAKADAKKLAHHHHVVMGFVDEQKRNPFLWNKSQWVDGFKEESQEMVKYLFLVQKDTIKGLGVIADSLNKIRALPQVRKTQALEKYFKVKEWSVGKLQKYFMKLLRDAQLREKSRRRDRIRGFMGVAVSDRREEKQERKEGKNIRAEYKKLIKDLHWLEDFYSGNKKSAKLSEVWERVRKHLLFDYEKLADPLHNIGIDKDVSVLYHAKHLFMVTIDMAFDLKEVLLKINKPQLFQDIIDDLEHMEKKERRLARKAA